MCIRAEWRAIAWMAVVSLVALERRSLRQRWRLEAILV